MIDDVEYLYICLFLIHILSLVKCLQIFCPFIQLVFCFTIVEFGDIFAYWV